MASSRGPYLLALLSGLDVDLGPFLEGLSQDVPDQRFTGNLHGYHVTRAFENGFWCVKLTVKIEINMRYFITSTLEATPHHYKEKAIFIS